MPPALPTRPLGALFSPWRAFRLLLGRPSWWGLAAGPFAINLGLFALSYWLFYRYFNTWLETLLPQGEGWWLAALYYLVLVVASLMLLAVMVLIFTMVGRILAAPFLELLTRRVERLYQPDKGWPEIGWLQGIFRVAVQEGKKLLLYLVLMVALAALNLIPGLGSLIYGALAWLVTCFFLALEFLDFPLERRGLSLSAKLGYVWRLGLSWVGLGTACLVLGVIPVINLALLPLAAMAGTLVYLGKKE